MSAPPPHLAAMRNALAIVKHAELSQFIEIIELLRTMDGEELVHTVASLAATTVSYLELLSRETGISPKTYLDNAVRHFQLME